MLEYTTPSGANDDHLRREDDKGRCTQAEAAARRAQLRLKEAEEKVVELNARAGISARRAPAPFMRQLSPWRQCTQWGCLPPCCDLM